MNRIARALPALVFTAASVASAAGVRDADVDRTVTRGLDWLAAHQSRLGHWAAVDGRYPTAMTALAGIAMLCEGSTTTQGKYAANIRRSVDYLVGRSRRTASSASRRRWTTAISTATASPCSSSPRSSAKKRTSSGASNSSTC